MFDGFLTIASDAALGNGGNVHLGNRIILAGGTQAHATLKGPLEDAQAPVVLQPEQEELSRLIRGEGEARAHLAQPRNELARAADREFGFGHRVRVVCPGT